MPGEGSGAPRPRLGVAGRQCEGRPTAWAVPWSTTFGNASRGRIHDQISGTGLDSQNTERGSFPFTHMRSRKHRFLLRENERIGRNFCGIIPVCPVIQALPTGNPNAGGRAAPAQCGQTLLAGESSQGRGVCGSAVPRVQSRNVLTTGQTSPSLGLGTFGRIRRWSWTQAQALRFHANSEGANPEQR